MAVRPTRLRRLRIQQAIRWATFAVVVCLILGTLNLVAKKHVTLVVDGTTHAVATSSANVRQLLVGQGIELTSSIRVVPPPATELADGMTVVVSPAPQAPGTIDSGSADVGVWAMDRATGADVNPANRPAETSVSAASVGTPSVVSVRVVVCGKVHDVLTNAGTTGELLSAMGVSPDANDRVSPSLRTPLHFGGWVRFDRVTISERRKWEAIPYAIHTRYTNTLPAGSVRVLREGAPGMALVFSRTITIDGKFFRRRIVNVIYRRPAVPESRLAGPAPSWGGTLGRGSHSDEGLASWYDPPWTGLTAANPWLPFGTHVLVTDLATGRSVVVVINDRGPFAAGKIIDLSPEAFAILSPLGRGVVDVRISW